MACLYAAVLVLENRAKTCETTHRNYDVSLQHQRECLEVLDYQARPGKNGVKHRGFADTAKLQQHAAITPVDYTGLDTSPCLCYSRPSIETSLGDANVLDGFTSQLSIMIGEQQWQTICFSERIPGQFQLKANMCGRIRLSYV